MPIACTLTSRGPIGTRRTAEFPSRERRQGSDCCSRQTVAGRVSAGRAARWPRLPWPATRSELHESSTLWAGGPGGTFPLKVHSLTALRHPAATPPVSATANHADAGGSNLGVAAHYSTAIQCRQRHSQSRPKVRRPLGQRAVDGDYDSPRGGPVLPVHIRQRTDHFADQCWHVNAELCETREGRAIFELNPV